MIFVIVSGMVARTFINELMFVPQLNSLMISKKDNNFFIAECYTSRTIISRVLALNNFIFGGFRMLFPWLYLVELNKYKRPKG